MINYILQVLLFQSLFLAVYDFFLQKETFFKWNRIYLLVTPLLSFLIPFLKLESMQQTIPQEYVVQLPTVFLNPQAVIENTTTGASFGYYLLIAFYIGVVVFTILFIIRLLQIITLIKKNNVVKENNYSLVLLATKQAAFSFFNYIFISNRLHTKKELNIIQHEIIHCKQKHSIDLLVFELLKIVLWFNPLIYVYQKRITLLHEYIADAEVVKATDKNTYFNNLLSETFNVENISFINQFYKQSFIKKRISMITKNKSEKMKQFKYLLIIPLLFGMLLLSSFENTEAESTLSIEEEIEVPTSIYNSTIIENKNVDAPIIKNKTKPKAKISQLQTSTINNSKKETTKTLDSIIPNKDYSFATIEEVPVFPGCEGTEAELRQCLQDKITKHVNQNFNISLADSLELKGGLKRIFVLFIIDNEGNITGVKARAQHKDLAEEAKRVINTLPKMTPGEMEGIAVGVKYSLPIAFNVEGDNKKVDADAKLPTDPIYVLDGKKITKEIMKNIDPDKIESINVLKGKSALEKYGEKGKNGVIEITSKQ